MSPSVTHGALDGSSVTISAEADLSFPSSSVGVVLVDGRQQEFTSGPLELGSWAAEVVSEVALTEEYGFQGGRLRAGGRNFYDQDIDLTAYLWVGVWEGKDASLITHLYGVTDSSAILALFDRFMIHEFEPGFITVAAKMGDLRYESPPSIAKVAPDIGLLEVRRLTPEVAQGVPAHPGTPVLGGELFFEDGDTPYFLLVDSRALTTIAPAENQSLDAVASRLASLTIAWKDAL